MIRHEVKKTTTKKRVTGMQLSIKASIFSLLMHVLFAFANISFWHLVLHRPAVCSVYP